jgi:hypothetical protein
LAKDIKLDGVNLDAQSQRLIAYSEIKLPNIWALIPTALYLSLLPVGRWQLNRNENKPGERLMLKARHGLREFFAAKTLC